MIDEHNPHNIMNSNNVKTENYLSNNHFVANFVTEVNNFITEYYTKNFPTLPVKPIEVHIGKNYIKLVRDNSVWAFISRYDGMLKGFPVRKGDLLKPASWASPAAHSRGNIIDGTAKYGAYGPVYMK
jgi:hypothetical protein